ncbi:hypothetical protein GCM10011396_25440 [Undibacterium terreum]|uniref:Solute-binding protein family 3/N-terminal domain-containing protein n=1 Tax=Undibacterium terreum TaxID=1224302 RepID=A0A916UL99_9BURK|nr:hypothetical protein GCM10011396_25440 [Undibacterium terreum]
MGALAPFATAAFSALLFGVASVANAECSRPITVPVSPTGTAVIIIKDSSKDPGKDQNKDQFSGAYVDVLRTEGKKEGCSFVFTSVPRARQELMFQAGQADLLLPATRLQQRDEAGSFVPMISVRATMISLDSARPALHNLQDLLDHRELKVALVRGYDYGDTYQITLNELKKQNRLLLEADPVSVGRLLAAGVADVTIMTSAIFTGVVQMDSRLQPMHKKLRYEVLDDLPWIDSGIYISNRSALGAEDKAALQQLFEHIAKSGALWAAIRRYDQPDAMKDSIRPRMSTKP